MKSTTTLHVQAGVVKFKIVHPNIKIIKGLKSQLEKQGLTAHAEIVRVIE